MRRQETEEIFTAIDDFTAKLHAALDAGNVIAKAVLMIWSESLEAKANCLNGASSSTSGEGLMTADEVAEYLRLTKQTIYAWVSDDSIPHLKLNGEIRFRRSALDAWMTPNNDRIEKARAKVRACDKVTPLSSCGQQTRSKNNGRL
ncbi:MAG TPA: helix-turn-helix domain-containing protein [Blastocatellia bacterium]|nr:helix-turn-helix domain-containing protein [Blastocatellia bacterium]HMZ16675.1 helix-turn-helix domain-containing protein [Blastocatellia bacterium]HNG33874.1 helix-turn-helix domain-containing protein [Blastocatellia bacterium]